MTPTRTLYRASHLLLGDRIIKNGAVEVDHGRIASAGEYTADSPFDSLRIVDLGDGLILPGLVNAHTHLEFSNLKAPLGHRGIEFTQWIRLIVAQRMSTNSPKEKAVAIQSGLQQCYESGTWLIGEIATSPCSLDDYFIDRPERISNEACPDCPIEAIVFLEQLGRHSKDLDQRNLELDSFLRSGIDNERSYASPATSPHAPYSVGTPLLEQMVAVTNRVSSQWRREIPVAMHVAETRQERELLEQGKGPFVDLLKDFGVWDPATFQPPTSIKAILKTLSSNRRSLIVHGNYLTDSEMDLISHCRGMSVIYCPRTHAFFNHDPYPLIDLLQRGINVAIGTDSLASNPGLDLFDEIKHVARTFPQLDLVTLLGLATHRGAAALGKDFQGYGSIVTGQPARLSFVRCPAGYENTQVNNWLWHDATHCEPLRLRR